jgi:hypothetical protein
MTKGRRRQLKEGLKEGHSKGVTDRKTTLPAGVAPRALALAAVLFLCPGFGWAQPSPLEAAQDVGLIGTWSASCYLGASESNWFVVYYATRKGKLRRRAERGSSAPTLDGAVDNARPLDRNRLRLRLRNDDENWGPANGQQYETVIDLGGGKLRTLSSINSAGEELVRNGRLVANDVPFPTLQRCSR